MVTLDCPLCGGRCTLEQGETEVQMMPTFFTVGKSTLKVRRRPCTFVACSRCEFCQEVGREYAPFATLTLTSAEGRAMARWAKQ